MTWANRTGAATAVIAAVLGSMLPATAAARAARIVGVFRTAACDASPCTPGADPALRGGDVAGGRLEIHVAAEADLGLEWVRLEAQVPGDPRWYCLEFWNAQSRRELAAYRTWISRNWTDPRAECKRESCSSCTETSPHHHGAPTDNSWFDLRVVGREQGAEVSGTPDAVSEPFRIGVQNPPAAVAWTGDPVVRGAENGSPSVRLRWRPSPEPGVVEYRFVRIDPSGERHGFAVDATKPESQGCLRVAAVQILCSDSSFSTGAGGTYRYQVAGVRRAVKGEPCKLVAGPCIVGPLNALKSVHVPPAATTTQTASTTASPATTLTSRPAAGNAPVAVAPPPPGDSSESPVASRSPRALWLSILAGILVMAAAGGHARRVIRSRRHPG